jgi:hypothetical protein
MKKRKFKVDRISSKESIRSINNYLSTKEGIISVELGSRKKVLKLEYDLTKIKYETIERWLGELGVSLSRGFFQRFKRGMAKFTEQNELDHLNAPVSSCCDDPKSNSKDCSRCITQ